jgi:hypothetical protein
MRKLSKWTCMALVAAMPHAMIACGGDEDDDTPGGGSGGTAGKGGSSSGKGGSSGSTGKGGSSSGKGGSSGSAGSGEEGGTGATGEGGTGATGEGGTGATGEGGTGATGEAGTGATGNEGGSSGAPNPPTCDLSGDTKEREALPAVIDQDTTLDSSKDYYIDGTVLIADGATLTIPKCTRLEGSPAPDPGILVAQRGGRIEAVGTADEPILFTSSQAAGERAAGQWGGVVLLGRAPITRAGNVAESIYEGLTDEAFTYGGDDEADDSGTLQYVRIEFGGFEIIPDKEVNGLSMAAVGSGTTIDHVMVSNTLDDCFEWWGGTVTANHLICNNPGDDYFDGDEGWQGGGEFWFGRRAQFAISSDDPNGLEQDSINSGELPRTNWAFSNVTLCGTGEDSGAPSLSFGMVLRELVTGSIDNLALTGFDYGIDTRNAFVTGDVTIENSSIWGLVNTLDQNADETGDANDDVDFVDGSIFTEEATNEEPDPGPFTAEECLEAAGPAAAVLDSDTGAFTGGAEWIEGAWVTWEEE